MLATVWFPDLSFFEADTDTECVVPEDPARGAPAPKAAFLTGPSQVHCLSRVRYAESALAILDNPPPRATHIAGKGGSGAVILSPVAWGVNWSLQVREKILGEKIPLCFPSMLPSPSPVVFLKKRSGGGGEIPLLLTIGSWPQSGVSPCPQPSNVCGGTYGGMDCGGGGGGGHMCLCIVS